MKVTFYRCPICGNVVIKTVDSGVNVVCCGEEMEKIIPQKAEAGMEKHLPVWNLEPDGALKVDVGSTEHPMLPNHYIQFIYVETAQGGQFKDLSSDDKPRAFFTFAYDTPIAVYEYCNVHGLWKTEIR
ncbi:MAG: desulfoferrodoxin [Bacteroidales bacterium]|nr:desulfoferrodoxin [Bacteroidales bacterium]